MARLALLLVAMLTAATAADAHVGIGATHGFGHGFAHPIGGIDHVLVMVAVGLLAARLGGRALWAVPLSFVATMAAGAAIAMAGMALPFAETAIALSVAVLGLAVATRLSLPTLAAMALVGLFALFHGHVHGAEMPQTASGLAYGAGFVLATASLHAVGIGLGLAIYRPGDRPGDRHGAAFGRRVAQAAGSAMAAIGLLMLAGIG